MDATEWKFKRFDGLPKGDGARAYRYFGFDADNAAYILRFSAFDDAWTALGFDAQGISHLHVLSAENAGLIRSHAACPLRWSDLGLPPRDPLPASDPTGAEARD